MEKKIIFCICIFISSKILISQNVTIPDVNFKNYLLANLAINTNSDNEIQVSEAAAYSDTIDCGSKNIYDLTGIEAFTSLKVLYCYYNNLTSLNLQYNTALTTLACVSNSLGVLDVSNNAQLTEINCTACGLSSLDVSNNHLLTYLNCEGNKLVNLNISNNPSLQFLYCNYNLLTSLDVSNCPSIVEFNCYSNRLTSLDIKNGNNMAITLFGANQNPSLSCIQVDDSLYSTTNWIYVDNPTPFKVNCTYNLLVSIPDINFKVNLLNNPGINTNGDVEIQVAEAQAYGGTIYASNLNIYDLTGIEAFTALTDLSCNYNHISNLNLSNNSSLLYLTCAYNQLSSLDFSGNPLISQINCNHNYITTINVTNNSALEILECAENGINSLNLSNNGVLNWLNCYNNSLTNLDLTNNPLIFNLGCYYNQLTSLDLSNNPALGQLSCNNNQLTSLDLKNGNDTIMVVCYTKNNPALNCIQVDDSLYFATNFSSTIDTISNFSQNCNYAQIVIIPDANFANYLLNNPAINTNGDAFIQTVEASTFNDTINCSNLNIADLTGIEAFTSLTALNCSNNQLTALLLNNAAKNNLHKTTTQPNNVLTWLNCSNNQLTNLNLANHISITSFSCSNNLLATLDIRNGNNTLITSIFANNNAGLFCVNVDSALYSQSNWTSPNFQFDPTSFFAENCTVTNVANHPKAKFKVAFPNPVTDDLYIDARNLKLGTVIKVMTLYGETIEIKVITTENDTEIMKLLNVSNGFYFVNISSPEATIVEKIFICR